MQMRLGLVFSMIAVVALLGCRKTTQVVVPDNVAPWYDGIPTVLVENYVNRLFIDLQGREPIDSEMVIHVEYLRSNNLSISSRAALIEQLQFDTIPAAGDSSYQSIYFKRLYEQMKVRLIEGASDGYLQGEIGIIRFGATVDSLNGDTAAYNRKMAEIAKFQRVIDSQWHYRAGTYNLDSMCAYMVNNPVYDFINMNSFNFINATFDNLYFRYPTQSEFERAYVMVDAEEPASLFGRSGTSKNDYINIIVSQNEFWQGLIIWAYKTLLARDPNTTELYVAMQELKSTGDFHSVQRKILMTDEYANFR
jgi:hypothetical protein